MPAPDLRIHFYGVQGSGSIFPTREEREKMLEHSEVLLLEAVMRDLERQASGTENWRIDDLLGGPLSTAALKEYRSKFDLPTLRSYGGWTTCVHIESNDGHDIVIDCGSGFRNCARQLQRKWNDSPERHLHVFGSHSHSDHTEGFDQAAVCFDARNTIHIYGNASFLRALDSHLGIFSRDVADDARGLHTPVHFGLMPASFEGIQICPKSENPLGNFGPIHPLNRPIVIGETRVTAFEVYHPAPCLAYRIDNGSATFVFCTDHEWMREEQDPHEYRESQKAETRLRAESKNADLLYRDGQFLRAEYEGEIGIGDAVGVKRTGWGHSCIEDVEEMGVSCNVKRTLIGHHDPNRDWSARNQIDEALERNNATRSQQVELARAELTIDL